MKRFKQRTITIKRRLLIIPLCSVLAGIVIIATISAYLTRESLLGEMREKGFLTTQQFIERMEDNTEGLETMNSLIEEQIRSIGNIVIGNRAAISDQYLTTLAQQSGINQIYWFNAAGEVVSSVNGQYIGWKAEPGDPIHNFMVSGKNEYMEDIRKSLESDESFKFGYIKTNTGEFVQAGVTADRVAELTQKFGYQALIDGLSENENIIFASFTDSDLSIIADSNPDNIGTSYSDDAVLKSVLNDGVSISEEAYYQSEKVNIYHVITPVIINGETKGALSIGYSMDSVYTAIQKNVMMIALVGLLVFLALGIILYRVATSVSEPLHQIKDMIHEINMGHLGVRLNLKQNDEIGEMASALDLLVDELQTVVIGTMKQISAGDVSANIELRDPEDEIAPALKQTIETIRALFVEATMLSDAAVAGKLQTRGNAEAFKGSFREIVVGVNATLDAVLTPLNVATNYVERIGRGEVPEKITDEYQGDFNTIKNSINACIDGLGALVEGNRILERMSRNDYTEKMSLDYQGIYKEIAASINEISLRLNRIVAISTNISNGDMVDFEVLQQVGKRSENDELVPSLVGMIQSILSLAEETDQMSDNAVAGQLSYRGNTSRFQGAYARVIAGFNNTLDAVINPINEANQTLKELASGNLGAKMTGIYQGDHALIKEDMNQTIAFLKRYVDEITETLEQLGQGNLDQQIETEYLGDFRAIKTALNGITATLSNTMADINIAAGQVEIGSQQISAGGQALSQGTTEQASAIQQLTASIEEVAGETKQNAIHANEANELALKVKTNAEVGNTQMSTMMGAMLEINDSSNNISKIIKVIDDIAFQTNILALNAAVEAARAGQHGKGFAVVAEEVRNLAARSAEAAKETTTLIEGSIDKVEVGTKIADLTAESLKEILNEIEKVTGLVGDIARASNEQATEIAQITRGIEQVSQVVQTNSATAEESAAASEQLSGQAEMLKQMVGAFKLKGEDVNVIYSQAEISKKHPEQSRQPQIILDSEIDKY